MVSRRSICTSRSILAVSFAEVAVSVIVQIGVRFGLNGFRVVRCPMLSGVIMVARGLHMQGKTGCLMGSSAAAEAIRLWSVS